MNTHSDLTTIAAQSNPRGTSASARTNVHQGFILTMPPGVLDVPTVDGANFNSLSETFRVRRFARNIRQALDGNCVGYGFAINQGGQRVRSGGGGSRQLRNNPDDNLAMNARRRMHSASVSKTLTAVCVLKALEDMGLSTSARVRDYLPSQWDVDSRVRNLTMADLLTHQTGFNTSASDPHYTTLRNMIENATGWSNSVPANAYDNRNFALFRLILPYLVCPQVMADVEAQAWSTGNYDTAVDQATQENYKILMRHYVFNPLGMRNIDCRPNPDNANRTMCYMWPNPSPANGQDGGDKSDEAGSEGWVLSARQLAKFLRFRRYSNAFLDPSLRSQMDGERFGWRQINGEHGSYLQHGGAYGGPDGDGSGTCLPGSGPLRTCIIQFPINVEVAVTVNSFVNGCSGPKTSLTRLITDAFDEAFV